MNSRFIFSIIFIAIGIAVLFQFTLSIINNFTRLNSETSAIKIQIDQAKDLAVIIDKLSNGSSSFFKDIQNISLVLPSGTDVPQVMVQVEALASENGLILSNIDFGSKPIKKLEEQSATSANQKNPAYQVFPISFRVSGPYQSFKNFIQSVEQNLRLLDVVSIGFVSPQKETDIVDFSVQAQAYYQ